jgi:hypothetical protein
MAARASATPRDLSEVSRGSVSEYAPVVSMVGISVGGGLVARVDDWQEGVIRESGRASAAAGAEGLQDDRKDQAAETRR